MFGVPLVPSPGDLAAAAGLIRRALGLDDDSEVGVAVSEATVASLMLLLTQQRQQQGGGSSHHRRALLQDVAVAQTSPAPAPAVPAACTACTDATEAALLSALCNSPRLRIDDCSTASVACVPAEGVPLAAAGIGHLPSSAYAPAASGCTARVTVVISVQTAERAGALLLALPDVQVRVAGVSCSCV